MTSQCARQPNKRGLSHRLPPTPGPLGGFGQRLLRTERRFHLAPASILSLCSHIQILPCVSPLFLSVGCVEGLTLICSADFISPLLPHHKVGLGGGRPSPSTAAGTFRISNDLAPAPQIFDALLFPPQCLSSACFVRLAFLTSCLTPAPSLSLSWSLAVFHAYPPPTPSTPLPLFPLPTSLSPPLQDSERKGFMNKLYAIQDVCISVQNALDEVASYGERIKK